MKSIEGILCMAALLLLSSSVNANSQGTRSTDSARDATVDAVFQQYDAKTTPGCAVAVIRNGKVELKKTYGMANIALGVPMTSATSFWVPYSEMRVFVVLAVAMLARDKTIGLDDPVRRYIPEVPAYAATVTVRQLIEHASGLADYGVVAGPGYQISDRMADDEFFRILARWGTLGFAPGSGRMYSNTDYALLKILVERVSGGVLNEYLDRHVFRPLGMKDTRIGADQRDIWPGHALFYEVKGDGFHQLLGYREGLVGGIGVTTSLNDVIRFEQGLRDPASTLQGLLEQFGRSGIEVAGMEDGGHPHGVYPVFRDGSRAVDYRGVGRYIWLTREVNARLAVATLCNAYPGMSDFAPSVASLWLGKAADESGAMTSDASMPPAVVAMSHATLDQYVGEYRAAGLLIKVERVGDALHVTAPGGARVSPQPIGDGRFWVQEPHPSRLEFTRGDAPGRMTLQPRNHATGDAEGPAFLRRAPPWRLDATDRRQIAGTYVGENVELVLHVSDNGKGLIIAGRGLPETALVPADRQDRFERVEIFEVRFERDASGAATNMVLDATRVKGIRFTRQP